MLTCPNKCSSQTHVLFILQQHTTHVKVIQIQIWRSLNFKLAISDYYSKCKILILWLKMSMVGVAFWRCFVPPSGIDCRAQKDLVQEYFLNFMWKYSCCLSFFLDWLTAGCLVHSHLIAMNVRTLSNWICLTISAACVSSPTLTILLREIIPGKFQYN